MEMMTHYSNDQDVMGALFKNASAISPCRICKGSQNGLCARMVDAGTDMHEDTEKFIVKSGEPVFFQGDNADTVYFIRSGALTVYKLLSDGRRHVTDFLFAGDMVGLCAGDTYVATAQALGDTELCRIPRNQLNNNMVKSASLSRIIFDQASEEIEAAQERMLLLARKTAQERLASFLLYMEDVNTRVGESDDYILLPMSRTDIADYLGLTVETVSRTITQFKAQGLIKLSGPSKCSLLDRERLQEMADGEF